MVSLSDLLLQAESEYLDFKQQYHDNNVKLLHDIICLANSYVESDKYLVFGIADDKTIRGVNEDSNRKTNANVQDLLRQSNFNRVPTVNLKSIKLEEVEIDVLTMRNRPDKPFFLTKDKSDKGKTIRAGVIYTRLGDTNTPLNESASDDQIELMWRERFGLGLAPLERMKKLLDDTQYWIKTSGDENLYHQQFPEFTIKQGRQIRDSFRSKWSDRFPDKDAYSVEIELRYFGTILRTETFAICDSERYRLPFPKVEVDESGTSTIHYVNSDSFAYKVALIYDQYFPLEEALELACIEIRD